MNGQFDLGAVSPIRYFLGVAAVVGLLLGFTSGEGDTRGLALRLLQWELQALGIMAFMILSHITLLRWQWFERRNPWLQLALSGMTGSLLFAPLGVGIDAWLAGELVQRGRLLSELVDEAGGLVPPAMVCWIAVNAPWILGFRVERREFSPVPGVIGLGAADPDLIEQDDTGLPGGELPGFMTLLPADLRGPVICLQAELHYVSVVTVHGRALVLYNLKDAMEELAAQGLEGVQCHRSYWVALEYIEALEKQGRQGVLRLANGDTIPVSRRNMDAVRVRLEEVKARQPACGQSPQSKSVSLSEKPASGAESPASAARRCR